MTTSCWNVLAASEPHVGLGLSGLKPCDLLEEPPPPLLPPRGPAPEWPLLGYVSRKGAYWTGCEASAGRHLAHWEKQKHRGAVGRLPYITLPPLQEKKKFPATMQRKTRPSASPRLENVEALQVRNSSNTETSRVCLSLHNSCTNTSECTAVLQPVTDTHWIHLISFDRILLFLCSHNNMKCDVTHRVIKCVMLFSSGGEACTGSEEGLHCLPVAKREIAFYKTLISASEQRPLRAIHFTC